MVTLFLTLGAVPVLVGVELAVQRWVFDHGAKKNDPEWELYQQRYD